MVRFDPHVGLPTLGARFRPDKNTLSDSPTNGFVRLLFLRLGLASFPLPFDIHIFLFAVVFTLGCVLTLPALRLQPVFLSGILVEFSLRQNLLASGAWLQEITEIHLITFHRADRMG